MHFLKISLDNLDIVKNFRTSELQKKTSMVFKILYFYKKTIPLEKLPQSLKFIKESYIRTKKDGILHEEAHYRFK